MSKGGLNIFQRATSWVARKIMAAAGYEGATTSRRSNGWNTHPGSADEVARYSVGELRDRSRQLVRNHWAARRASMVLTGQIVGRGIMPSSREDEQLDALLSLWQKPQTQVGSQKGQSLGAVQRLVCKTVIESGSALVVRQFRTRRQMRERDLVMPFQLQVLEPEFLDTRKDGKQENGNVVVYGVEYDKTGWPVAYHLYREHPNSTLRPWNMKSVRIDASNVAHVLWQERPGQTIGIPWFAPVLVKISDFDDYEDAQLLRQKIASLFVGFIRPGFANNSSLSSTDIELAPGRMQYLDPGEDVEFAEPPTVAGYADFSHINLRAIASGMGLTYEDLSGDYSRVNFSSARMGSLVARMLTDQWQTEMMVGLLCQSLDRWARQGARLLLDTDAAANIRWTPPRRELLDPSREVGAITRAIDAGLTSRQEEVRRLGRDAIEVDQERAQDQQREEQLGLAAVEETGDDAQASVRRAIEDTLQEYRLQ